MARQVRQMIKIDEDKCNGCGLCVPACAEGAIQIVDGKAKVVAEKYCDGLGACLGECPQGAISFETREAEDFDEARLASHLSHSSHGSHCPSARTIDRTRECPHQDMPSEQSVASELRQWPVKLHLVNPAASFFQDADLLIVADCVPFAHGSLHPDFLRGKVVVAGCPKFDDIAAHTDKLTEIFRRNDIRSVTVLQMEVPCCSGLGRAAETAISASGKSVPTDTVTISLSGETVEKHGALV
jgi:NAD-dependent dihydropyrimidine dehydrogenase PreA subunit